MPCVIVFVIWITPFATLEGAVPVGTAVLPPPVCGLFLLNRLPPFYYPFYACFVQIFNYSCTWYVCTCYTSRPFCLFSGTVGGYGGNQWCRYGHRQRRYAVNRCTGRKYPKLRQQYLHAEASLGAAQRPGGWSHCFFVFCSFSSVGFSSVYILLGTGMMITVWAPLSSGFHANSWQTTRFLSTSIPNTNNGYHRQILGSTRAFSEARRTWQARLTGVEFRERGESYSNIRK